jgi:hypothetical protein
MTGWILSAFLFGYLAGAATVTAWGFYLSRKNLRRFGDAIPMK